MFDLFDYDNDGKISKEDLLVNLKLLLASNFKMEQIKEMVDKTVEEYGVGDKISFKEFVKILENSVK